MIEQKHDERMVAEHVATLKELDARVNKLEISQEVSVVHMKNVHKKLDELQGLIRASIMLFVGSLVTFFFWYIQKL